MEGVRWGREGAAGHREKLLPRALSDRMDSILEIVAEIQSVRPIITSFRWWRMHDFFAKRAFL